VPSVGAAAEPPAQPPTTPAAGRRRAYEAVARTVLALAAIGVLVWIGSRNAHDLSRVRLHLSAVWLVPAVPLTVASGWCLATGWREELAAFGHRLPVGLAVRLWWRAQLARYVPTGLAAVGSRAALARSVGVPGPLGAASFVLELATLVGWAVLVAAVGIPSSLLAAPARVVLGVAAGAGLATLPLLYRWAAGIGRRIPALATLSDTPGRHRSLYAAVVLYGGSVTIRSVTFAFFAAALVPVHGRDVWLLAGALQGASVIGMIGVTPAGLGIREGALVGLLGHRFGNGDAAAVAVAWRAWEFAFELGWLGLGTLVRQRQPGGTPAPAANP